MNPHPTADVSGNSGDLQQDEPTGAETADEED